MLTCEVLRRKAESALIWYEDFRYEKPLSAAYWQTSYSNWSVWQGNDPTVKRPYSQLEGSGQIAWKYGAFTDIHLRKRIALPQNGAGRAGVFCGNVFCCINIDTQRIELYQGGTLLGIYAASYERTPDADIRTKPLMYLIEMRIRRNNVRVYSGSSSVLCFTANISPTTGSAGIQSDNHIKCELLRAGDAWTYEPYEAFDLQMPDSSFQSFGRINRAGVTWDNEFQTFKLNADIEETATRSEEISMDYDFQHSGLLPFSCGNDYTVKYIPRDICTSRKRN